MSLNRFRISDKDNCPCGSGKVYSECCKNKKDKKENIEDISEINNIMKKSFIDCCMFPDKENCSKSIVKTHPLQSNEILNSLADDDMVYTFAANKSLAMEVDSEGNTVPVQLFEKVNIKNANIQSCFCENHDQLAFHSIEEKAFDSEDEEQKFTSAYKAFIFEYYDELIVENMYSKTIKDYPSLLKNPNFVKAFKDNKEKIENMVKTKEIFDIGRKNKDYSELITSIIILDKEIQFSNFAAFQPWFDINGKTIKSKEKCGLKNLFITIIPGVEKSYIMVSCLKEKIKNYKKLFNQVNTKDKEIAEAYFNFYMPLFSRNIVICPSYWEKLEDNKKKGFLYLTNLTGRDAYEISLGMQNHLKNLRVRKRQHVTNPKSYNLFEGKEVNEQQ